MSRLKRVPVHSTLTIDLDSDASPSSSPSQRGAESPYKGTSAATSLPKMYKRKGKDSINEREGTNVSEATESHLPNESMRTSSPESQSFPNNSANTKRKKSRVKESGKSVGSILIDSGGTSSLKKASKERSPKQSLNVDSQTTAEENSKDDTIQQKGNGGDLDIAEEETSEKRIEPRVSNSRLPLVLSDKVHRSKALVECEGESIDLSGDMGAVGRIVIPDSQSGIPEMYLDLKGTIYKTKVLPSRTFCVVSFGQSEAKIEAVMNDFIQLEPHSNVYEAETMIEGTLDGFSFDSEDEAEKVPKTISHRADTEEGIEEQTNGKGKGNAEKSSGVAQKKSKAAGGKLKPVKKAMKKTQISKKAKSKK